MTTATWAYIDEHPDADPMADQFELDSHGQRSLIVNAGNGGVPPHRLAALLGPDPSYLDPDSGGPENDLTDLNTTFTTYNLVHLAATLRDAGGISAFGSQRSERAAGCRPDQDDPEHR